MNSQFEQYSITFGVKEDKVDIFKAIVRFLDYLTRHYKMGFTIVYVRRNYNK